MNTSKLNIKITVSDINGDEIISRDFGTDYYDDAGVTHAILKTIEDADGYICNDCDNTREVDDKKCHCLTDNEE